jgi:hypothetical protein
MARSKRKDDLAQLAGKHVELLRKPHIFRRYGALKPGVSYLIDHVEDGHYHVVLENGAIYPLPIKCGRLVDATFDEVA